jgi:hypothetical protein
MRIAEGVGSANAARGPVGRGNVASLLQTRSSSSPAASNPCREQPGPRYRHLQNTDVGPRAPLGSGGPPELWARVRAHIFRTSRIPAARLVLSMSSDRCTCRESVGSFGLLATRLKSARGDIFLQSYFGELPRRGTSQRRRRTCTSSGGRAQDGLSGLRYSTSEHAVRANAACPPERARGVLARAIGGRRWNGETTAERIPSLGCFCGPALAVAGAMAERLAFVARGRGEAHAQVLWRLFP